MSLGFTAGGGLLVGVLAGLLLISGGGDASEAEAAKNTEPAEVKVATTYGDLAAGEGAAGAEPANATEPGAGETGAGKTATGTTGATDPGTDATEAGAGESDTDTKPEVIPEPVADPTTPEPAPAPEPTNVELRFDVTGLEGGAKATITLGDDLVSGTSTDFSIEAGKTKARVKLVVKADGYRVFRKTLDVTSDMTVPVAMRKRPAPGTGGGSKGKGKGKGKGPGGLLDL